MDEAPSLILEALAAVITPVLLKAGLNLDIFSLLYLLGSSSYSKVPSLSEIVIGAYSQSNEPLLIAAKALS